MNRGSDRGVGSQPGDRCFAPSTLAELLEHWRRLGRLWVPRRDGGRKCLLIDLVVEASYANDLPIHALVTARVDDDRPPAVMGLYVGEPPPVSYPLRLLVVRQLPGEPEDLYWHPHETGSTHSARSVFH